MKGYSRYRFFSQAGTLLTIVISLLFFAASLLQINLPFDIMHIKPFTAVMFGCMSLAFLFLLRDNNGSARRVIAAMPVCIILFYLSYILFTGTELSIKVTTFAGLVLISAAIFFSLFNKGIFFKLSQAFVTLAISLAFLSLIGDLYESDIFVKEHTIFGMNYGTSLVFLIFSVSILVSKPDKGIMEVFLSNTSNGSLLRRLTLIIIVIPIGAGWLGLKYEDEGVFSPETGDTFFIFLFIATPVILIWRNFHLLYRADKELRNKERLVYDNEIKLRAIVENTMDAIYIKDLEGRYIMANPAAAAAFEMKPEEMLGKTDTEITGKTTGERIRKIDAEVIRENITYTFDTPTVIGNKVLYFHTTKFPYVSPGGKIIGLIGISRDITEKKKTENELLMLSLLARYSTNAVFVMDKEGRIEWINEGFTKLTQYSFEEVKGKRPDTFLQGELSTEEAKNSIREGVQEGINFTAEIISYRKDGSHYNASVEITPIRNSSGEIERYVAVETDITEEVKTRDAIITAKEAAEKSAKAKDEFLANMSHEMRTPMNAIIGFTDLLMKSDIPGEERQYLNLIKTSGENLLTVINDLLDFSKLKAKKLTIVNKDISIKELLDTVCNLLSLEAKQKGLDVTIEVDEKIPHKLIGDPVRLNQIFFNLIGNAIKFTPGGFIHITARLKNSGIDSTEVEFSIKDTGIGIPTEKIDTIFESFSQASSDTARMYGGTGLGLAIVRRLLELMGGAIHVKSSLGKGSEFIFNLPFRIGERENRQAPAVREDESNNGGKKLKILIAEDNRINIILIQKIITTFGFEPHIAENGQAAVDKLKENTYDMVLMDIQMPVMDGITATRVIREELKLSSEELPIIALTASMIESDKERCFDAGMDDFILKPFNADVLYKKIMKYYTRYKIPA